MLSSSKASASALAEISCIFDGGVPHCPDLFFFFMSNAGRPTWYKDTLLSQKILCVGLQSIPRLSYYNVTTKEF